MKTKVIFSFDEDSGRWEVRVTNVLGEEDARHAFNAVVRTIREIPIIVGGPHLMEKVEDGYKLSPAVSRQ